MSTHRRTDKDDVVHTCSGDDLATRKAGLPSAATQMALEETVLSEKSDGHCTLSFIRGSQKQQANEGDKMKELTEQSRGYGGTWGGERHRLCGVRQPQGRTVQPGEYSERLVMTVNGK